MLTIEDLRKAEDIFKNYISHYDMHDGMIYTKVKHSYKVEQNSIQLAKDSHLEEYDMILQGIIGLFHDIGRFEQARIYHDFRDAKTVDHADFGVQILKQEHILESLLTQDELELVYIAILNHNKLNIQGDLDCHTLLHSKLIRDADKIDILRLRAEHDEDEGLGIDKQALEEDVLSDYAYETFMSHQTLNTRNLVTRLDGMLTICGFIYDLNVESSKKYILENDYLQRIITYYDFKNIQTKQRMEEIVLEAQRYLQAKTMKEK